ncbi:hypothetical protein P43SY_011701 [Pythium insidiosum]|uniref:Reverse transcriptase domain-containing protein n=1 Tax=Pythium insidiosum TaxID=114742 RepID=A0AAD5Q523_PYTIN|nr:hypothetical protein P43SY_011701 [Pythium insidiosum]
MQATAMSRSTSSRKRERSVPRSGQVYYTYDSDEEASWNREPKTVRFKVDERYDDDSDVDDLEDDTEVVYQAVADRSQERRGWQGPQSSGNGGPPPYRQTLPSRTPGHTAESCRKLCPACNKVHQPCECPKVKVLEALKTWAVGEENAAIASQLPAAVQQHSPGLRAPSQSTKQTFRLQPGERRGWWSYYPEPAGHAGLALIHGAVCSHRVDILLDSGSTPSILSLALARRLGLDLKFDERLKVKGIGGVVTCVTAKAVASTASSVVSAGVRLSAYEGTVRLPDEESIPLVTSGSRPTRPTKIQVCSASPLHVMPGMTAVVPIVYGRRFAQQLQVWLCRGPNWLTTLVVDEEGRPKPVRVANVSAKSVVLAARTAVAHLVEEGHLPDRTTRCVRAGSIKYEEWQTLIYEATHSREFVRRQRASDEENEASLPSPMERRDFPTPRKILPRCAQASAGGDGATAQVMLAEARTATESVDSAECPVLPAERLAWTFKAVHAEPERTDSDDSGERSFYIEGDDRVMLDELRQQLAELPLLAVDDQEPDIDAADIGEPGETTSDQHDQVLDVLRRHRSAFLGSGNALPPPARGVHCDIEVPPDTKAIAQKPRRIQVHLLPKVYELLEQGLIKCSDSEWASPIVVVMKKNGKDTRLCIDYRLVNQLITLMTYPLPLIDELLDNFDRVLWFLSLDMASGFWAVRMTDRARRISAFTCPLGHFQWVRMPFGLKNAPLVYQQMLDNCLWGFVRLPPELEASVEPEVLVGVGLDPAELLEAASASPPAPLGQPTQAPSKSTPAGYVVDGSKPVGFAAASSSSRTAFELGRPASRRMGAVLGRSTYIDNVAGGGSTWEEMVDMLDRLFFRLRYWRISVNLLKSSFGKRAIQ